MDDQSYAAEPEALVELVKETVRHLIEQRPDTTEQEKQLQEVARAISRLEQMGLPVPDALRQLKMELAATADEGRKIEQQLKMIASGLTEAVREIQQALGRTSGGQKYVAETVQNYGTPKRVGRLKSGEPKKSQRAIAWARENGIEIDSSWDLIGPDKSHNIRALIRAFDNQRTDLLTATELNAFKRGFKK